MTEEDTKCLVFEEYEKFKLRILMPLKWAEVGALSLSYAEGTEMADIK